MPYNPRSGQATAAFLDIKRKSGMTKAKAFGRKHRKELSAAAKARHGNRRGSAYVSRSSRSASGPSEFPFRKRSGRNGGANRANGKSMPPAFMRGTQA